MSRARHLEEVLRDLRSYLGAAGQDVSHEWMAERIARGLASTPREPHVVEDDGEGICNGCGGSYVACATAALTTSCVDAERNLLAELERLEPHATPAPWGTWSDERDGVTTCGLYWAKLIVGDGTIAAHHRRPDTMADVQLQASLRNGLPFILPALRDHATMHEELTEARAALLRAAASLHLADEENARLRRELLDDKAEIIRLGGLNANLHGDVLLADREQDDAADAQAEEAHRIRLGIRAAAAKADELADVEARNDCHPFAEQLRRVATDLRALVGPPPVATVTIDPSRDTIPQPTGVVSPEAEALARKYGFTFEPRPRARRHFVLVKPEEAKSWGPPNDRAQRRIDDTQEVVELARRVIEAHNAWSTEPATADHIRGMFIATLWRYGSLSDPFTNELAILATVMAECAMKRRR